MNQSDYIAVASAIVAGCALGVSLWQGYLTRQHNRLMVRPRLEVVAATGRGRLVSLSLRNGGLGPALLGSVSLAYRGETFQIAEGKDYERFGAALLVGLPWKEFQVHIYLHDHATNVLPGESIEVFRIDSPSNTADLDEPVRQRLSAVSLTVQYQCVYENTYTLHKQSLAGAT